MLFFDCEWLAITHAFNVCMLDWWKHAAVATRGGGWWKTSSLRRETGLRESERPYLNGIDARFAADGAGMIAISEEVHKFVW